MKRAFVGIGVLATFKANGLHWRLEALILNICALKLQNESILVFLQSDVLPGALLRF